MSIFNQRTVLMNCPDVKIKNTIIHSHLVLYFMVTNKWQFPKLIKY